MKTLFQSIVFVLILLFGSLSALAQANDNPSVYQLTANKSMAEAYADMQTAMNDSRYYLFFELNIGKNLAGFAENWGKEYNKNNLSGIRTMVFCNGTYANRVSNLDPTMLASCPLHLTLIENQGKTTVLFNRPTVTAKGSPAYPVFVEIEQDVITMIKEGME